MLARTGSLRSDRQPFPVLLSGAHNGVATDLWPAGPGKNIYLAANNLSIVFFSKFARQTQARHRHPVDVDVGQATAPSGQPSWAGGERAYSYGGRTKLPCRAAGVRDGDRRCRVAPIVASVTRDRRRQVCAAVRSPLRNGGEEAWTCVHTYMPLCALLRILPRSGSVMPACSRRALPPAPPTVPALSRARGGETSMGTAAAAMLRVQLCGACFDLPPCVACLR